MTTPVVRRRRPTGAMERPLGWRNPLAEFDELLTQMGGLLESTVGTAAPTAAMAVWTPPTDITETDEAYLIELELPGVKSEHIDIEVSGQDLVVTGEIKERERKGTLRRSTRRTGRFEYRVVLPSEVNTEGVKAEMSEGILMIAVPKAETAKPRHVEITARSGD
jgi:HSP20 family protein